MRTGEGARAVLTLAGTACLLVGIACVVVLAGDGDEWNLTRGELAMVTAALVVCGLGTIVSIIGYLLLTELQAQSVGALGPPARRRNQRTPATGSEFPPPPSDDPPRTVAQQDSGT